MNDLLGLVLYITIALVGFGSTMGGSIWTWRLLRRYDVGTFQAALIVTMATIVIFGGLWLVFALCWIIAAPVKAIVFIRRMRQAPGRP